MKPQTEKLLIEYAQKYRVGGLWVFGSALTDEDAAGDIDIGVEGLSRRAAWDLYSELFDAVYEQCGKVIDFVEMDEPLAIATLIRSEGRKIYDATA